MRHNRQQVHGNFFVSLRPLQDAFTALERCRAPVIAAVQGACIGAGIDLATAADIRCCTAGAVFCVKEIDLGITADLGTLQQLRLVGEGADRALPLCLLRVYAHWNAGVGSQMRDINVANMQYHSQLQCDLVYSISRCAIAVPPGAARQQTQNARQQFAFEQCDPCLL